VTDRTRMHVLAILAAMVGLVCVSPAQAEETVAQTEPAIVVELFTSQGCSSCPPADRLLKTYVARKGVVALSLPVDYWDYLGWKDTFGQPAFSQRQRGYAQMRGDNLVYTPQVVVNGLYHAVGSRRAAIDAQIARASKTLEGRRLALKVSLEGAQLSVARTDRPGAGPGRDVTVWLAMATKAGRVAIGRGENEGREVTYHHVVRELKKLGTWKGDAQNFTTGAAEMAAGIDGCVVLIQDGKNGPIVAAAELWGLQPS